MKIAFDTNILLDLLDERRAGYNAAALLLQICSENNIEIVAFADSILTIKYIMRKENNIEIIEALELLFEILNVIDTKADAVLNALRICKKYNFEDVEDITKLFNAKSENCELFITNDKDLINLNIEEIDIAIVGVDEILKEFGYHKNLLGKYVVEQKDKDVEEFIKLWQKLEQKGIDAKKLITVGPAGIGKTKTITDAMLEAGYTKEEIEKIKNKKDE